MVSTLNSGLALAVLVIVMNSSSSIAAPNYKDALTKSILFFQGQRSGKLPKDQLLSWRSNSGLRDGSLAGVDLSGGYYDAGDNVKFNFPMAYTTTMLSWGVIEFGGTMSPIHLSQTRTAIQWATNYFLKCVKASPGRVYVGVGDPNADHKCWERPEDMDTLRSVYNVSSSNPGSDVAAEMAAALASASIVFRAVDVKYSAMLLSNAKKLFTFANKYRGSYNFLGGAVCPFYCSYSGYKDELLWGASWLFKATKDTTYLNLLNSLGANDATDIFSWDNKFAGARVLLSRMALVEKNSKLDGFRQGAEDFMCKILPQSPYSSTKYTPGGLMYKLDGSNLQYVTAITSLLTTYAKYMAVSKRTFFCGNHVSVTEKELRVLARRQIDYILGSNPLKMSYMVGYGNNYPKKIHHRGSSLPSLASHRQPIGCSNGFQAYYYSSLPNPNLLIGAIVGGPNQNDAFSDDRTDYSHSEPATYINAAIVGPLAYFAKDK